MLVRMNVLTRWPITKDAIEVLLKASGTRTNDQGKIFNPTSKVTRLHNICIPKLMKEKVKFVQSEFKAKFEEPCESQNENAANLADKESTGTKYIDVIY